MENSNFSKKGVDLNTCAYCKCSIDEYSRTIDHFYPKSRGGKLSTDNKIPCCFKCNQLKANQTPKAFLNAIQSLIFFETQQSKEKVNYLRKVRNNLGELIKEKENGRK